MQTLSSIEAERAAERERARRFEFFSRQRDTNDERFREYDTRISALDLQITEVEKLITLANSDKLGPSVLVGGTIELAMLNGMPAFAGFAARPLRDTIKAMCGSAYVELQRQRERLVNQRAEAERLRAEAIAELKTFTK
jgi:hypothetical protein